MVWSTNQQKPYLSGTGVHNIKQTLAGIYFGKNFEPHKPKTRKSGTGDARQVNGRLRESSLYPRSPDCKRKKFNVYAKTGEECEKALKEIITEKKSETAKLKNAQKV